jgi:hypothetical protein
MPDRTPSGQRERSFPSPESDAGAVKDSRLPAGRGMRLSRGPGGVPTLEHEGSLGLPWRLKKQGSASMPAGEDEHRSQRRSWTRDGADDSQRMSGADPCIAPGTIVSGRAAHHRRSGRPRSALRAIACSGCSGSEQEPDNYYTADR